MTELTRASMSRSASLDPEFWVERGRAYADLRQWDRAAADFIHAIDLKVGRPLLWYHHAVSSTGLGDNDAYTRVRARLLSRVIAYKPRDPEAWIERGRAHAELRQWANAVADLSHAIELKPITVGPWLDRGRAHAERGAWAHAAADLTKAIALGVGTDEWWVSYEAALCRLGSSDLDGYRDLCVHMLARFGQTDDPDTTWGVALACALAPNAVTDSSRLVLLAEKAVAKEGRYSGPNWRYRGALGLALYRAGRWEAAIQRIRQSMAASPEGENGANWLLLAMAHHRLGHTVEARRWLQKGLRWRVGAVSDWHDRLLYQLLRREAEALTMSSAPSRS